MNLTLPEVTNLTIGHRNCNINDIDIIILPPFVYLNYCQINLPSFKIGAQNCSQFDNGPYTGEVSAKILSSMDIQYCLLGHSERKIHFNENNDIILSKINQCIRYNIIPIVCFGENEKMKDTSGYLESQLSSVPLEKVILAYEPTWCVGKNNIITKFKYFERMGVYEIPMRYDSSQDLDKWTKRKNKFRENMTKMAKMSGKEYNIDDEKYVDFGPKSNDWVNLALDKFYELYKEHYKDGKLLIWNDDEYDRHKQQWDYPMDKAYFLSEIEYWIEDTFEIDTTGFYEWILDCQYIEGRYWENTWMYDLEDINFRKKIANDNIITINDIIKKIFKVESMNIYMDYYKEYKRED
jgi:hypothetical protein